MQRRSLVPHNIICVRFPLFSICKRKGLTTGMAHSDPGTVVFWSYFSQNPSKSFWRLKEYSISWWIPVIWLIFYLLTSENGIFYLEDDQYSSSWKRRISIPAILVYQGSGHVGLSRIDHLTFEARNIESYKLSTSAHHPQSHTSHEKKNGVPYFPLNPGCLIGILWFIIIPNTTG